MPTTKQNPKYIFYYELHFFDIWRIQHDIFHPGKTPHEQYNNMYNNTIHLEELQQCYYNFLQNWNCVNPFTPKSD